MISIRKLLTTAVLATSLIGLSVPSAFARETAETRDLATFSKIRIKGAVELNIEIGKTQSVEIITEEDFHDRIETSVRGKTLTIDQDDWDDRDWRGVDVVLNITLSYFEYLQIDGAADVDAVGINSKEFGLQINGAGDIHLEGTCEEAEYEINGAGDLDAKDLECKIVDIEIRGAGDADVFASEEVSAGIFGVGDITAYGNPSRVSRRIFGMGDFTKR
jgi:hypothetical protein